MVAVPSYNESFGLVALEAQAAGSPVVAAAVGGLPVAVDDGVTGSLVAGHEPQVWADALADVVLDPAKRERLADGGTAASGQVLLGGDGGRPAGQLPTRAVGQRAGTVDAMPADALPALAPACSAVPHR